MMSRKLAQSRHRRWEALLKSVSIGAELRTVTGIVLADAEPNLHGYFPAHDQWGAKCFVSITDLIY